MRRIAALTLAAGLSALAGCSGTTDDLSDDYYLKDTCKDWVKDKLKAPSTADFGGESVDSGPDADGYYAVSGYVDAENSFGAKIRSSWTCQIRVNAANDGWQGSATLFE